MRDASASGRPPARAGAARRLAAALAITAATAGTACAQGAETVLDPLTVAIGPVTYRVGPATLQGSSLTRDGAALLLTGPSGGTTEERLRQVTAKAILIPEIVAEVRTTDGTQTTTYRDIRLDDVAEGRISALTVAGGTLSGGGGSGRFGRLEMAGFDLPYAASLYAADATGTAPTMRPVYGSIALSDLQVGDAQGGTTRIGRIAGLDLQARPIAGGWAASLAALADETPDPGRAGRRRVATALTDLMEAFAFGSAEATWIAIGSGPDAPGRIDRVLVTGSASGAAPSLELSGLDLASDGNRVRIRSVTLGGTGGSGILRSLVALSDTPPDAIGPAELRGLVPPTASLRVSGLAVDVPGGKPGAVEQSRLGDLAIAFDRPVDGVPTAMRLTMTGLDVPTGTPAGGLEQLAGLGYERVGLDASASIGWREDSRQIVLDGLAVEAPGLGRVTMSATFGNASRDLFSPDSALATVALVGLSLRSLDLVVRDGGLAERVVAREAAAKGVTAEDVRRGYGLVAAIGVPALIGSGAGARAISQAIARFAAKPGTLTLKASSKDAAGVGLFELGPSPDPGALLERFDVSATAE